MFKKRGTNKKTFNLQKEMEDIEGKMEVKEQTAPPTMHKNISSSLMEVEQGDSQRIKSACLDSVFKTHEAEETTNSMEYLQQLKKDNLLQHKPPQNYSNLIIIEENSQQHIQSEQQPHAKEQTKEGIQVVVDQQPEQRQKQVIVVEEDSDGVQIIEEYGPQTIIDSEQQAYESSVIKKSLTKQNYARLNINQRAYSSRQSKQQSLLNKLDVQAVIRNIERDQNVKKATLQTIQGYITTCKQEKTRRTGQLTQARNRLQQTQAKFDKIKKVLQFLYERGDQVRQFTLGGILQQIASSQYEQ